MAFESYTQSKPWKKVEFYSTPENLYLMRLGYGAGYGTNPGDAGVDNPKWVAWIKQTLGEYQQVRPYFYGDFYPLAPYSLSPDVWTAWQWNRPESKDGLAIVLRRPKSPAGEIQLNFQHLKSGASYEVEIRKTYDRGPVQVMTGNELSHLKIQLADAPSSAIVFYRQK
jgi:hypothetical protein